MYKYSESGSTTAKATQWSVPQLVYSANHIAETHGSCVILLDDFHKLDRTTASVMYEFLLERRIGDFNLHPKVAIICAQNFSEESGTQVMEEPIKDRLSLMHVAFDFDYWYANFGKYLHHYISSFIKANPQYALEDESVTLESNASPRSWSQLSNEFALYDNQFIQDNAVFLASQKISAEAAGELAKHIAYMEAIDFSGIIQSGKQVDIDNLSIQEQLIWPYSINYIHTPADAAYMIKLINSNIAATTFTGYIAAELYFKFQAKELGKPITPAQDIVINKLLGTFDIANYKLTKTESELLTKTNFTDSAKLLEVASVYI